MPQLLPTTLAGIGLQMPLDIGNLGQLLSAIPAPASGIVFWHIILGPLGVMAETMLSPTSGLAEFFGTAETGDPKPMSFLVPPVQRTCKLAGINMLLWV